MERHLQETVSAFQSSAANGAVVDSLSMTQWLKTSFWGLPSRRCRHMFLDAAILLRRQPLQDLRCAWIAMLQFDDGLAGGAAARSVDGCLAELVTSSLVSSNDDTAQRIPPGPWADVPHLVQQCAFAGTPVPVARAAS